MDDNVETVLRKKPSEGFGKRKAIDGSISGSSNRTPSSASSWEVSLLKKLCPDIEDDSKKTKPHEEEVEEALSLYLDNNCCSISDLLMVADINPDAPCVDTLREFGLNTLVSIYCTRGKNFGADFFKEALQKEGVKGITAHKVYAALQSLRLWRL